jgi:hypothetical protein
MGSDVTALRVIVWLMADDLGCFGRLAKARTAERTHVFDVLVSQVTLESPSPPPPDFGSAPRS